MFFFPHVCAQKTHQPHLSPTNVASQGPRQLQLRIARRGFHLLRGQGATWRPSGTVKDDNQPTNQPTNQQQEEEEEQQQRRSQQPQQQLPTMGLHQGFKPRSANATRRTQNDPVDARDMATNGWLSDPIPTGSLLQPGFPGFS